MAKLTDGIAGSYQMTREQMEAFAAKSNETRDRGRWTSMRWRVKSTLDGPHLEEYESAWQKAWRPSETERETLKAEATSFAERHPWLTMAQYAELVDRYGSNIPDRFEVTPPQPKKQIFLRREEFDRIVAERGRALSYMLDIGAFYRDRDGFTCHPSCRAQVPANNQVQYVKELR